MNDRSDPAKQREQRLMLLEDHIGRALSESRANRELRSAPSYGKLLKLGDGFDETPDELRMGMRILKDAGALPPQIELMRDIDALRLTLVDWKSCASANLSETARALTPPQQGAATIP